MIFALNCYENKYGGLHGMNTRMVVECTDEAEAEELAILESYQVMDSYLSLSEEMEEEAQETGVSVDEIRAENVAYEFYRLREDTGYTIDELDEMFWNERDDFLNDFGWKEK